MGTKTKPPPKSEIGITTVIKEHRIIMFDCVSVDALEGLENYGSINDLRFLGMGYSLKVNGCFEFQEVLDYIMSEGGGYAR